MQNSLPPQAIADLGALSRVIEFLSDKKNRELIAQESEREIKVRERLKEIEGLAKSLSEREKISNQATLDNEATHIELVKRQAIVSGKEDKYAEANAKLAAEKKAFVAETKLILDRIAADQENLSRDQAAMADAKEKLTADQAIVAGLKSEYEEKLKAIKALAR